MGDWLPTLPWHLYTLDHSRIYPQTRSLMFPYFLPSMLFSPKALSPPEIISDTMSSPALRSLNTIQTCTQQGQPHHTVQPGSLGSSQRAIGLFGVSLQPLQSLPPQHRALEALRCPDPMSELWQGWRTSIQETGKLGDAVSLLGIECNPGEGKSYLLE